jgi:Tfp pilus assembly protein PilW
MRLPSRNDDSGLTLVEVLVAVVLTSAVLAFVTQAAVLEHKALRIQDNEAQGLADVRVATERLAQDIRNARSVVCNPAGTSAAVIAADPNCTFHLQLWIDSDSDYLQQASETITWQLVPDGTQHFDMVRSTAAGVSQVEARTVVNQVAFTYAPVAPGTTAPAASIPGTTEVKVDMTYRAVVGSGEVPRTVSVTARLRNAS